MTTGGPVLEVDAPSGRRVASTVAMGAQRASVAGSISTIVVYYVLRILTQYGWAPMEGSEEMVHLKIAVGALAMGLIMGAGKWLRDHGWETVV